MTSGYATGYPGYVPAPLQEALPLLNSLQDSGEARTVDALVRRPDVLSALEETIERDGLFALPGRSPAASARIAATARRTLVAEERRRQDSEGSRDERRFTLAVGFAIVFFFWVVLLGEMLGLHPLLTFRHFLDGFVDLVVRTLSGTFGTR